MIAGRTTESQNKCCGQAEAGSDDDPDKEPLSLLFAIDARDTPTADASICWLMFGLRLRRSLEIAWPTFL